MDIELLIFGMTLLMAGIFLWFHCDKLNRLTLKINQVSERTARLVYVFLGLVVAGKSIYDSDKVFFIIGVLVIIFSKYLARAFFVPNSIERMVYCRFMAGLAVLAGLFAIVVSQYWLGIPIRFHMQ